MNRKRGAHFMKANIDGHSFTGLMVAGLLMAAVFGGAKPDTFSGMTELPVKKSGIYLTEYKSSMLAMSNREKFEIYAENNVAQFQSPGQQAGAADGQQASSVQETTQTVSRTITAGQRKSSGKGESGSRNPGNQNPGNQSPGNQDSGNQGPGNQNSGNQGPGSQNPGSQGSGSQNPGVQNPGGQTGIITEGEKGAQSEPIFGGATLTMLNSQSDSQMLSVIIQTSQGSLIVVDGGLGKDGDYLRSQIQARGNHVSAWLITHPHGDHAGALYRILQDEAEGAQSGMQIDGIYYSFAAPEWYTVHDPSEQTMAHAIIGTFSGLPETMLHQVSKGQTIQVDDVTIQVMNDRYELSTDKGNNAGIVYKMLINGKSILFLGDMAEEGGRRLLAEAGPEALKSDIVQMAHHGQNGVGEEVYQAINPSICLWPTPQWLWENSSGKYRTGETKNWMSRLNVQKHYCMKDGDQIIR